MTELIQALCADYGAELSAEIVAGYVARRTTLRINTLKAKTSEVFSALSEAGLSPSPVPWYADAIVLEIGAEDRVRALPLYDEGKVYLQSLSSMLPPLYLEPKEGESILDMTAAPGGKTSQICALSGGKSLVTACERDKIRFDRLKFNLERQGAPRVTALKTDALMLDDFFSFDKILLDAPCSGSGTFVSSEFRFTAEHLKKCVRMQEKLLAKGLKLLKKGGRMVYSTCSVLKDEGERVLERVLPSAHAHLVPVRAPEGVPLLPSAENTLCVRPDPCYEGFFVAVIEK